MKENDGRGARRVLTRRIGAVLVVTGLVVVALWGYRQNGRSPHHHDHDDRGGRNGLFHEAFQPGRRSDRRGRRRAAEQVALKRHGREKQRHEEEEQLQLARHARHRNRERPRHHHHRGRDGSSSDNGSENGGVDDAAKMDGDQGMDIDHDVLQQILDAHLHLVDIEIEPHEFLNSLGDDEAGLDAETPYNGIYGKFCHLEWSRHKDDPNSVPMFRDLVQQSPNCRANLQQRVPLSIVAGFAREFDKQEATVASPRAHVLTVSGFVFHESRCGSTLVANALAAVFPDRHRVYSESSPPLTALKSVCGEAYDRCSQAVAARVFRDTVYLMSRSNDPHEERVFFKIQSAGSRNVHVFLEAFPTTPWMFVYREPVEVLMSQLAHGIKNANCVRSGMSGPISESVQRVLQQYPVKGEGRGLHRGFGLGGSTGKTIGGVSPTFYCAAHLASITETALHALNEHATVVNYNQLPDILWTQVLPSWGVLKQQQEDNDAEDAAAIERMQAISQLYSKGRGDRKDEVFHEDSADKKAKASQEVRDAAAHFLLPSYQQLEQRAARPQQ